MTDPFAAALEHHVDEQHFDADGARLLDEVEAALRRYVVLPSPHTYVAVALWIAATHGQQSFQSAPRLAINSPEKRCGKTRLLDIIEALVHRALIAFNATPAALFRSIDGDDPPTLLLDEADTIWSKKKTGDSSEDLRALINAGFGRGRPAIRCVGPQQVPTEFPSFAMAALAGIGDCLPDTVTDRAVRVTMRRRAPGERVQQFRQRRDGIPLHHLRDDLSAWVRAHLDELAEAEPDMPLEDRAADTWEPLIAIADLAGGEWPARARTAATIMCRDAEDGDSDSSLGVRLLADCQCLFRDLAVACLSSEELVRKLRDIEEAPWQAFDLSQRDLSRRLRHYGIKPDRVRPDGGSQVRGYRLEDFSDAFARYLADRAVAPSQSVLPSQVQVSPVTGSVAVTLASVTTVQDRRDDGHGDSAAAGQPSDLRPAIVTSLVTDPSVTATQPVTGLQAHDLYEQLPCDAVTGCDAPTAGHYCADCDTPVTPSSRALEMGYATVCQDCA